MKKGLDCKLAKLIHTAMSSCTVGNTVQTALHSNGPDEI